MRTILYLALTATVALGLSNCSNGCGCGSYNKDYLRDVPVTTSQSL